jgi:hypothetical protein
VYDIYDHFFGGLAGPHVHRGGELSKSNDMETPYKPDALTLTNLTKYADHIGIEGFIEITTWEYYTWNQIGWCDMMTTGRTCMAKLDPLEECSTVVFLMTTRCPHTVITDVL